MKKNKPKRFLLLISSLMVTALMVGGEMNLNYSWAESTTTKTTTTQVENDGDSMVTTEKTETETPPEKKEESHSLLGSLFIFIGNVVAFPFRLIGGVFDAIF